MTKTDHFEAGLATLSADAKRDFPEQSPWKVNGVAIPSQTVVEGGQNVKHFYPKEVLENAGELLEGKPIVVDFHELDGQADASNVIGEVTSAGHQKGVGLVFEGEILDADTANKIKHGYLDVSPTPARSLGEFDESMGAQRVERLADFRDLAVVANGQPGAKVEMGENPAVEALAHDTLSSGFDALATDIDRTPPEQAQTNAEAVLDIRDKTDAMTETGWERAKQLANGEELSTDVIQKMAQFNRHQDNTEFDNFSDIPESRKGEDAENPWWEDNGTVAWLGWGGTAGIEWAVEQSNQIDTNQSDTLQSDMKSVAGVKFKGTKTGKLDESAIDKDGHDLDNHYLYGSGDDKKDFGYPVVDADGFLRKGNVKAAWNLGCRGKCDDADTHDEKLMDLANEFDNPPEFAQEETDTNRAPEEADFDAMGIESEGECNECDDSETISIVNEVPVEENLENEVIVE